MIPPHRLRATFALFAAACLASSAAPAFLSTEHKKIGDEAFIAAAARLSPEKKALLFTNAPDFHNDKPQATVRASAGSAEVGWFTFGDLVAIFGDMVAGTAELNSKLSVGRATAFKHIALTDLPSTDDEVNKEGMELAYVNETHFGDKAVDHYVSWHQKALETAKGGKAHLAEALQYEAAALHSFTDLFATGHMMIDRKATMKLMELARREDANGHAEVRKGVEKLIGAATALMRSGNDEARAKYLLGFYANFYHNGYNHWGAKVTDLSGHTWQAYGDHRLMDSPEHHKAIINAASESIGQVLSAAAGTMPSDGLRNSVLRFVPVRYTGAACSVSMEKERATVLKVMLEQNIKILQNGGIDARLLKKQPMPDGAVTYLAEVKKFCGKACTGR